jgi:hypothetical protein
VPLFNDVDEDCKCTSSSSCFNNCQNTWK